MTMIIIIMSYISTQVNHKYYVISAAKLYQVKSVQWIKEKRNVWHHEIFMRTYF